MKIKNNKKIAMFVAILMIGSTFWIMGNSTTTEETQDLRSTRDFDEALIFTEGTRSAADSVFPFPIDIIDFRDEIPDYLIDIQSMPIITTSESYLLYDNQPEGFGGYWADCEKSPSISDDDLCCWAATAANMLEWTGWGFIYSSVIPYMDNCDDFLYCINNHTTPNGSFIEYALEWWFNSNMKSPGAGWASEDVEGGGFFATEYEYTDWVLWSYDSPNNVQQMAEWLHDGYAVGITIYNKVTGKGGHCITVWGYEYDNRYDSENPHDYYLGLYVSDSDDRKNNPNPPDLLRYVELSYNTTKGFWEFGSYKISGVTALKPYPESRPKANAGGIYIKNGEKTVDLDGSRSYDDSIAGTLKFRWDFTNDGSWDTEWNFSSTISHTYESDFDGEAKLEVFDGRLRDVDFAYIREVSIEPTLIDSLIQPNKLYILPNIHNLEFRGIYTDPKVQDFYNYNWDFGDGAISDKPMVKHMYAEPGTYLITLTISLGTEVIGSNTISIKVITESAHKTYNINECIQSLDSDAFLKNPDERKTALDGMLINDTDSVLNLLDEELYDTASEKLQMIRKKMDGEPKPKDWIIDSSIQNEICDRINDFLAYLETI